MTSTRTKGQPLVPMLVVLVSPVVAALSLLPEVIAEPTQIVPMDTDEDGDVDRQEFIVLSSCLSGPMSPHDGTGMCYEVDNDLDGHVDMRDYAALQTCFSGSDAVADPLCAESHTAAEIAQHLVDAGFEANDVAQLLGDFGFPADEVAGVLADFFGLDAQSAAQILKNIGFSVLDVAEALKIVFNLEAEDYACEGGPWDSAYCSPGDSLSCTDTSPVCVYGGPAGVGVCWGGPIDGTTLSGRRRLLRHPCMH